MAYLLEYWIINVEEEEVGSRNRSTNICQIPEEPIIAKYTKSCLYVFFFCCTLLESAKKKL
jgi:hypothetical protein